MIYFMRAVGTEFVKIGFTDEGPAASRRIATLQMGCPHELRIEAVRVGTRAEEKQLQRSLASKRTRGEWFALTAAEVATAAKCPAPPPEPGREPHLPRSPEDAAFFAAREAFDRYKGQLTISPEYESSVADGFAVAISENIWRVIKNRDKYIDGFLHEHAEWVKQFVARARWEARHGDGVRRTCKRYQRTMDGVTEIDDVVWWREVYADLDADGLGGKPAKPLS